MGRGMTLGRILALGIAVATLTIAVIVVEPLRLVYAVAFCLLVPGSGWAAKAREADAVDRLALSVVFSLSATVLVATAMAATGTWSVTAGMAALAVIAILGFVPLGSSARHRKPWRIRLRSR